MIKSDIYPKLLHNFDTAVLRAEFLRLESVIALVDSVMDDVIINSVFE